MDNGVNVAHSFLSDILGASHLAQASSVAERAPHQCFATLALTASLHGDSLPMCFESTARFSLDHKIVSDTFLAKEESEGCQKHDSTSHVEPTM